MKPEAVGGGEQAETVAFIYVSGSFSVLVLLLQRLYTSCMDTSTSTSCIDNLLLPYGSFMARQCAAL